MQQKFLRISLIIPCKLPLILSPYRYNEKRFLKIQWLFGAKSEILQTATCVTSIETKQF